MKITTFSDGHQLVTGSHTYRLTNLATGEPLVLTELATIATARKTPISSQSMASAPGRAG
ncbi:MAG TPA: hypothetical protein VIZ61_00685 [Solirubrobacterales bacterium]